MFKFDTLAGVSKPSKPPGHIPRHPAVVLQPQTYQGLQQGTHLIINAIRPTLGPLPRLVALEKFQGKEAPEFMDDGATIARRIIQVRPRSADVGAMLVRHALWQMRQEAGDGTTTMGVIYQALLDEGIRAVTLFGCNPMLLRSGLERGLKAVLDHLRQEVAPLAGKDNIARIARGMCQEDPELAEMLGEILDIVGADGMIVVEGWNKRGLDREYVEGTYWDLSGWFSRHLVTDPVEKRTVFEDAALFISDLALTDPAQVVPVLEACTRAGVKRLVIIAKEVSDSVIGLLVNNNRAKTIETLAVRTPRTQEMERVKAMNDIAVLTGGKMFYTKAEENLEHFRVEDLGYARRAWATESLFGLFGGKGDMRQVRKHINDLRGMLLLAEDDNEKEVLQRRIGRMLGGTAILRVGGLTDSEREARKTVAARAVAGLRTAVRGGILLGGGTALLNGQAALAGLDGKNDEEAYAFQILARALEEPMRCIARNAGYVPDVIVEKVKACPRGYGFEARSGKIIDMQASGIVDSALVLEKALAIAVSGAAMALTTDVIVHHRLPKETIEP